MVGTESLHIITGLVLSVTGPVPNGYRSYNPLSQNYPHRKAYGQDRKYKSD